MTGVQTCALPILAFQLTFDHTFVDPAYRGQKLAEKLVYTGVELARRDGDRKSVV